ncbi:MAG TPA: deoxynucleoside kinase [Bacteroidia bacterium]|nr:deoxynucleoside kinase [Bacteroidia bacterium]
MQPKYPYLIIEGNIGAGKTTLAKRLAADMGSRLILEQFEDNSFLPKFYNDPKRFAFPLELSFLASRFTQLKEIIGTHSGMFESASIIADYSFFKNLVFSRITLEDDEFTLFYKLYEIINPQLPKGDLIVYVHQPVNRLVVNINKRGRSYEQDIQSAYLEKIEAGYFEFFRQMPKQKVLVIDAKTLDFASNEEDYQKIKHIIFDQEHPEGISRPVL